MNARCILSSEDRQRIHALGLRILADVGVQVDDQRVQESLHKAGARDGDAANRFRLPEGLVADALAAAPREAHLADRLGGRVSIGPDAPTRFWTGAALRKVEGRQGQSARIDRAWLKRFARLVDALPNTSAVVGTAMVDCVPRISDFVGFRLLAGATRKHLRPLMFSAQGGAAIIEMGRVLADGDALRERPVFSVGYSIVTPLRWEATALGLFRTTAGHGIPVMVNSEPMAGASAPVTLAGAIALGHAEVLSGIVINQLLEPGRPCIYNLGFAHVMEMRSATALTGAPENGLLGGASGEMAAFLGLPSAAWMCTEATCADAQAAYEKMMTGQAQAASGVSVVWGVGQLESEMALSLEQAVLDDEIAGMIARYMRGVTVDTEHLAESLILRKGFDGFYLDEDHTLQHYRDEIWRASISFRDRREAWERDGRADAFERARARVDEILGAPRQEMLTAEQDRELEQIERHYTDALSSTTPDG